KSERVPAYRLLSASSDGARAQTSAGALIGRDAELATLEREFARAVTDRSCRSVTLVADAGVGKSRLVEEFARRVDRSASVRRGPLVVLFEDVHWGELMVLDLIEHVAVSSSDAPMLILCTARPEFDEGWPGWGPAADSARIDLGALSAEETALVVRDLLGGSE